MADGGFGWSEGIAALSLGVSIFALAWAKTSAEAAKQANKVQLHSYRRALLLGFHNLLTDAQLGHVVLAFDKVYLFNEHAKTCYLYVDRDLASKIEEFYNSCRKVAEIRDEKRYLDDNIRSFDRDSYPEHYYRTLMEDSMKLHKEGLAIVKESLPFGRKILSELQDSIKLEDPTPSMWSRFLTEYNKPFDWGDKDEPQ